MWDQVQSTGNSTNTRTEYNQITIIINSSTRKNLKILEQLQKSESALFQRDVFHCIWNELRLHLATGYDYLQAHLYRISLYPDEICLSCRTTSMDGDYLQN
ncbi:hypothetical protein NPIL_587481 [Nephila pilipes]|uniref:Uncharacterized protein n=1 Tax=Nephila pilipes TaxID=299642 RepID=A0A8X6T7E4_NEPPI|nr:hypothetical protein NPIL_587481 [Nephila pilipes]